MKIVIPIGFLFFTLLIGTNSYCQRWVDTLHVLSPNVKGKIDSLYPDAWMKYSITIDKTSPTRFVVIAFADSHHYGCTQIYVTCDTNGGLIKTGFRGLPLSYLPDTIKKVIAANKQYKAGGIEQKTINSKGEISYDVDLKMANQAENDLTYYVWSFKSSGELLFSDKRHAMRFD